MLINSSLVSTGYIHEAPAGAIFVASSGEIALIAGIKPFAVFTTGQRGWQGFQTGGNEHWAGMIFAQVGFALELNQFVSGARSDISAGDLAYRGGALSIFSNGEFNSIGQWTWLALTKDDAPTEQSSPSLAFKGWSAFVQDGNDRINLLEVQNGAVTGGLLHKSTAV